VQQRLQQRVRAARGGEGGFTLIELLIVIVILGVLAGIVVFSVNFITDRGTNAACKTDIKNVQAAVEAYRAQNTGYPASMDALVPNFIRSAPDTTSATRKYTIAYDGATGLVTGKTGLGAAADPAC
jgi:general secretion pathway protein G